VPVPPDRPTEWRQQMLNKAAGGVLILTELPYILRYPHQIAGIAPELHLVGARAQAHGIGYMR
jgi:hypothetical protein